MKRKRKANRKRDAKGHFIKKTRTKRRRNPVANPRRRAKKRTVTTKRRQGPSQAESFASSAPSAASASPVVS